MAGGKMVYPYTALAKIRNFPWRYFWNESRIFRFMVYTFPLPTYAIFKLRAVLDSDENRRQWVDIRGRRLINYLDPHAIPPNKIHVDDDHH